MKIFNMLDLQWDKFDKSVRSYISKTLGESGNKFGVTSVFGQILTVINSVVQNLMLYIEDATTEQSIETAQRKSSIYSLARLSGFQPYLGSTSKCNIKMQFKPSISAISSNIVINNKTKLLNASNGLIYTMILPQESLVLNIKKDNTSKYINLIEGVFETQTFYSEGGELYSLSMEYSNDIDLEYTTVYVNGEKYKKVNCLYDMLPMENAYYIRTSLDKGIDIIFGNGQHGNVLNENDLIEVNYLLHNGELGNITDDNSIFTFANNIYNVLGDELDGNELLHISLETNDGITSGTYSQNTNEVKEMIGYNSRALVLATPQNYKAFLNKYSFVGYNRCWSENGVMVVNALVMRNYKQLLHDSLDYYSLNESDFTLTNSQESTILQSITESNLQMGGIVLNFIKPNIQKYAAFVHLQMKPNVIYDELTVNTQVKSALGEFFGNIKSDQFIPKSDLIETIKQSNNQIDGINIYLISERNELAKINNYYIEDVYTWNPLTQTYQIHNSKIPVAKGTNPNLGFDKHNNIYLESDMQFPVLMGNWSYVVNNNIGTEETVVIDDAVTIFIK